MSDQLRAIIGNEDSFWLWSSEHGFDLTHPRTPDSPQIVPRVNIKTTSQDITIDPVKTALVVIDMQNFFLSPALGRDRSGPGHRALKQMTDYAIPAARDAGIQVIWLNWGLSDEELRDMPPSMKRAFGFEAHPEDTAKRNAGVLVDRFGQHNSKEVKVYRGLGQDIGTVVDPVNKAHINAGRLLMRDQWNTALYPPLAQLYEEGRSLATKPDVWVRKNRLSGLWGAKTELAEFLEQQGLKTLLFTGVNTDQCVSGTLTDAFSKGYDCILLSDGTGTTSPSYGQECVEFNSGRSYGFVTTCEQFSEGVAAAFA